MPRDGATVSAKDKLAQDIAKAVGAGRPMAVETVDFSDPNRPKTCIEVDFPILAINQIAQIEGNAGKPIYQMSKWWARRRSSVFRAMLLASAMKAPDDPAQAAKAVWEAYYANHQKKGALKHLKVADIFMGGGTTLVEGSRLGMQMSGVDLNPVAWFVVKQEFAKPDLDAVKRLLADVEAEVKPQIMPFYACEGPAGEKGVWTRLSDKIAMGDDFDPLALKPEERKGYAYSGPEMVYTFWIKHGHCQVTGCGHRTPIVNTNIVAVKSISIRFWAHRCVACQSTFDIEEKPARMAPDVPLVVADSEGPYAVLDARKGVVCPHCRHTDLPRLGKASRKKVDLSLLIHPSWLTGCASVDDDGFPLGGTPQDDAESNVRWNVKRGAALELLEVRGRVPAEIICPTTGETLKTGAATGTVPKKAHFECARCGTVQDVLDSTSRTGKGAPYVPALIQGMSYTRDASGAAYGGRFFSPLNNQAAITAAEREWQERKNTDLAKYWPRQELPYGLEADFWSVRRHGYTHWYTMFNPRQLLCLSILAKGIDEQRGRYSDECVDIVIAAFQQYIRNQCMMTIWNLQRDSLEPQFAKNNFRPKIMPVENSFFCAEGRGNWTSCIEGIFETLEWSSDPWEILVNENSTRDAGAAKSTKIYPRDPLLPVESLICGSATNLTDIEDGSLDLCVTDPPFGNLMQYAEWADFFYSWMRPLLREQHACFRPEATPKTLEVVSNKARQGDEADAFYRRLLTQSWHEVHRKLKAGGLLAFTFHHDQDEPWIDVLASLFDAGFVLEATYPIRGDETKGDGEYGSQRVEYDIIHVCRKRTEDPKPVSWARMRREVLEDVKQLQGVLEAHAKEGLPAADLAVIKRGKALEYFSRHYGQVFKAEGETISVKEAIIGINQILDEGSTAAEIPPVDAEPYTRQFLRIFADGAEQKRDQMQKFLRGTGSSPDEFEERGWCSEKAKVYHLTSPLEIAQSWHKRQKRKLDSDYDQAMVLIGACHPGSGLDANDTLRNPNFKPHPALRPLLEWFERRGHTTVIRDAAKVAKMRFDAWQKAQPAKPTSAQMSLFGDS
ncbi:DUF1156 domain-containing protein [Roseococcus sp. DSY-14]|uniref:DUF1156 domain-containing protein n=1 Tax=Roseomonadaceae TaxID=3385906 RepID=UPI0011F28E9D|nr:DUF1156 domain-containing protein [Siccirubricoccus phaeus]